MLHLGELIFTFIDMIIYTIAISFFLSFLFFFTQYNQNAELKVNEKVNVIEMAGEYEEKINTVNPSEVLSEIKEAPLSLSIRINSYHVTHEDREKLTEYNDASALSNRVERSRNYQKEYTYDNKGHIVEIIYHSV